MSSGRVSAFDDTVFDERAARSSDDGAADGATSIPELVGGRYRIEALLGVGGMGSVYRARDLELDELVALKVLRRELVSGALVSEQMLTRFRQAPCGRLGTRATRWLLRRRSSTQRPRARRTTWRSCRR